MLIQVHRTDDYFTRSILRAHQVVEVESTAYPNDPQDFADRYDGDYLTTGEDNE